MGGFCKGGLPLSKGLVSIPKLSDSPCRRSCSFPQHSPERPCPDSQPVFMGCCGVWAEVGGEGLHVMALGQNNVGCKEKSLLVFRAGLSNTCRRCPHAATDGWQSGRRRMESGGSSVSHTELLPHNPASPPTPGDTSKRPGSRSSHNTTFTRMITAASLTMKR